MAIQHHQGFIFSDLNPVNREAVDRELLSPPMTELCVRNNRRAPTDKRVIVHIWTDTPSHVSFTDWYLSAGETRATHLSSLGIRAVKFEIRWKVIGNGSPMWATTGEIMAPAGEFFPAFGIRWNSDDTYEVIFPD